MKAPRLASLPSSTLLTSLSLLLVCTCSAATAIAEPALQLLQWPPHELVEGGSLKRSPEHERLVKRGLDAHRKLISGDAAPVGMRRMSGDPDEMFFLDYWLFEDDDADDDDVGVGVLGQKRMPTIAYANGTDSWLSPPMRAHDTSRNPAARRSLLLMMSRRSLLRTRDFSCPSGYSSCAGIGRQYSCCASGSTCVSVQNNGLGDVGCCASGASCSGSSLGTCDASQGFKNCPGSSNGGCCLPGFDCLGVGCVSVSTSTITTTLGTSTSTSSQSTSTSISTSTTTTTVPVVAPVRPTSAAPSAASADSSADAAVAPSIITTTGSRLFAICPTNYYFCSAYYRPGCCQIGRDCKLTNCPAAASSSTFLSNGVTVVVPVGPSTGGTTYESTALITGTAAAVSYPAGGSCMDGWATCAQSLLGGCCPQGFSCGAVCTGSVGGASETVVAKMRPNQGALLRPGVVGAFGGHVVAAMGVVFGVLMIVL